MVSLIIIVIVMLLVLLLGIFTSFISHVVKYEAAALFIVSFCYGTYKLGLHPVYSTLLSLIPLVAILAVWRSKIGFWVLSTIFSIAWGALAYVITDDATEGDIIWMSFIGVVAFFVFLALHLYAQSAYLSREKNHDGKP